MKIRIMASIFSAAVVLAGGAATAQTGSLDTPGEQDCRRAGDTLPLSMVHERRAAVERCREDRRWRDQVRQEAGEAAPESRLERAHARMQERRSADAQMRARRLTDHRSRL